MLAAKSSRLRRTSAGRAARSSSVVRLSDYFRIHLTLNSFPPVKEKGITFSSH